jgi:hypothetical protein
MGYDMTNFLLLNDVERKEEIKMLCTGSCNCCRKSEKRIQTEVQIKSCTIQSISIDVGA